MKTLSPLAAQILPMLNTPMTVIDVLDRFASHVLTAKEIETAIDELIPALVTCDEHEGIPYFYRRDHAAERTRAALWSNSGIVAARVKSAANLAAERIFDAAMRAADDERDAADPMAAIKAGKVVL